MRLSPPSSRAFSLDPAFRFFFPDDVSYVAQASAFVGYLFNQRLATNSAWITDNLSAGQ